MQIIQLVSLVGFLALVLGSLSVRNMQFGFIVKTVIGWAAIAACAAAIFSGSECAQCKPACSASCCNASSGNT